MYNFKHPYSPFSLPLDKAVSEKTWAQLSKTYLESSSMSSMTLTSSSTSYFVVWSFRIGPENLICGCSVMVRHSVFPSFLYMWVSSCLSSTPSRNPSISSATKALPAVARLLRIRDFMNCIIRLFRFFGIFAHVFIWRINVANNLLGWL